MPRIFDNIESRFVDSLRETLAISNRADFCVGYFSLAGWSLIEDIVERWSGTDENACRLLIGMNKFPTHIVPDRGHFDKEETTIDLSTAVKLKQYAAEEFRNQIKKQVPSNQTEAGLRKLAVHLREKKLRVKVFLRHPLHAKLYLAFRSDPINPRTGFIGSSNLSYSGLSGQGELNIDVLDHDATQKLSNWFKDRWEDRWSIDISVELAEIIEKSWVREDLIPPYHIYLTMAYHLSREARNGLLEFTVPREFKSTLFEFQSAAVRISAHHLNKRGGVLLGDVVGLGKTMMATAIARIFQDDFGTEAVIICPKNLVKMWQDYAHKYRLLAQIVPVSQASTILPKLRRYRLAIIDESHNLRNREGKRYRAIREYLLENECKCILLSATPYNKSFQDISAQLRLFVPEDQDLGIRPEQKIKDMGEIEFVRQFQCSPRTLKAFEASEYPDDWRELMRLFMVRRTRTFIQENYAKTDTTNGRRYLDLANGQRSYFPRRVPKTVKYKTDGNKKNQYAILYSDASVESVISLELPRYGLANYLKPSPALLPTEAEKKILQGLSRAGKRLIGVCRTNLFKRLESGGPAFILSLQRHILRNEIVLHSIRNNLEIPIGTQSLDYLSEHDEDIEWSEEDSESDNASTDITKLDPAEAYKAYRSRYENHFKWIRSEFFSSELAAHLEHDIEELRKIIANCGTWDATNDPKIKSLLELIQKKHPSEKVLIFTQFADSAKYIHGQLVSSGIKNAGLVTGETDDPAYMAWRFSPTSNGKREEIHPKDEFRILVSTDVLSEGVNLQDSAIIINYDLPWAIIRLVQRAGRVDRIGQQASDILCYSFMPAEGIERVLGLRARVRRRLRENAEVIGTDEAFFEDEKRDQPIVDIYNEKAGVLDADGESEVDLASYAYQIWKNAVDKDPSLEAIIPDIPPVAYSARSISENQGSVLLYLSVGDGTDALAWIDSTGASVTQSQLKILEAARCEPGTVAKHRSPNHHFLVEKGVRMILDGGFSVGGQLGRTTGPRYRVYERLKKFIDEQHQQRDFQISAEILRDLEKAIEEIYRFPLKENAAETLKRQLRSGLSDFDLSNLVLALYSDRMLCSTEQDQTQNDPQIICSLGLVT